MVFLRILKNLFCWWKKAELILACFQGPPPNGCYFFLFFFFLFSSYSASSKRVLKHPIFIGFFEHPSKTSTNIMQQQSTKASNPPKKCTFFRKPLFWPEVFFCKKKTPVLHHPLRTVPWKNSPNPILIGSKKVAKLFTLRWPSYWPWSGQDVAKLLTLQHIYIHIYIYIHSCNLMFVVCQVVSVCAQVAPLSLFISIYIHNNLYNYICV